MVQVALLEPMIAPNTGNIARLCAATGSRLHLIGRLGFRLDDRSLRRAGVDCWSAVECLRHADWDEFVRFLAGQRLWLFTARGGQRYCSVRYQDGDCLVFGNEAYGLPAELLHRYWQQCVTIPQPSGQVRSLNLASAVAIGLYEALRQVQGW